MNLEILDRSNYFRGLLLLIGKDKKIESSERQILTKIGSALGFEKKFVSDAIRDLLVNKFIVNDPPVFTNQTVAMSFLIDGVKLALADEEMNKNELEFLESTAEKNGIQYQWFSNTLENLKTEYEYKRSENNIELEN